MRSYLVRAAIPADLDEIIQLCSEHAQYEQAEYDPEGKKEKLLDHLFSAAPRAYCLVVESVDAQIIGYATYTKEFSTWDADFFVHVDCLYLRPAARNRRIGWVLGKHIARATLDLGIQFMQFQTPPFNTPAIRIYEAMGARKKDKIRFYANRDDMLKFVGPGLVSGQ